MRQCGVCEKEIPAKRLAAMPDAEYCVACQGYIEWRKKELGITERPLPTSAMAAGGETDDSTRSTELGWGPLAVKRLLVKEIIT